MIDKSQVSAILQSAANLDEIGHVNTNLRNDPQKVQDYEK